MLGALTDFASCYWLLEALLAIAEIESRKTTLTTTCDHLLLHFAISLFKPRHLLTSRRLSQRTVPSPL